MRTPRASNRSGATPTGGAPANALTKGENAGNLNKCGTKKSDDGGAPEEGDGQSGDADDESQKSQDVTGDDLEKSLQKLEAVIQAGDTTSRKEVLLQKSLKGDDLSKAEREELFQLLGGASDRPATPAVGDQLTKGMQENPNLQKALDVSEYLAAQHEELCKSLTDLGAIVEKSDTRQQEFNLVLAKAVYDTASLVKGMSEKLGVIASQPARPPKSAGVQAGQVLNKSFGGQPPAEESNQLSKGDVLNVLDDMMAKSMSAGTGGVSRGGEDLLMAISKYEQTSAISPTLLREVVAHQQEMRAATH